MARFHILLLLLLPIVATSSYHVYDLFRTFAHWESTPPTETSSFEYAGGDLLVDPITVYFFWIGNWRKRAKSTVHSAVLSLSDHTMDTNPGGYPTLAKWWEIATQYKDARFRSVSRSVSIGGECFLDVNEIELQKLHGIFAEAFNRSSPIQANCTRTFRARKSAVYHVLFSQKLSIYLPPSSMIDFLKCSGRANLFKIGGVGPEISLAWERVPYSRQYCNLLTTFGKFYRPPNGRSGGLDSLISNILAQTADMATNWDFRGWLATSNLDTSIARQCPSPTGWEQSTMPVIHDREGRMSWNVLGKNGSRFLVQQLWNQDQQNCALQPLKSCHGKHKLTNSTGTIKVGLVVDTDAGLKVGLQPYNPNLHCEWRVNVPMALHIRIHLLYLALDRGDFVEISYDCIYKSCEKILLKGYSPGRNLVDVMGKEFLIKFTSGSNFSYNGMGWMIGYEAGFCKRRVDVRKRSGSLTDGTPEGANYMNNSKCLWDFRARKGSKIQLQFTRLDTVQGKDTIRIYQGDTLLAEYSGNTELPEQTFIGPIRLLFTTHTRDGQGWAIDYRMDSPETSYQVRHVAATVLGAVCGMIVLSVTAVFCCSFTFLSRGTKVFSSEKEPFLPRSQEYSLEELSKATNNFAAENVVTEGLSGKVFRGIIGGWRVVAVKNQVSAMELDILSRVCCTTIVNLVGFSCRMGKTLLVFDYMPRGSLARHLFDKTLPPLSWKNRLEIAFQISRAVEYLHTYAEPYVVHLNISAENVLLDDSRNARLGGFGRAFSSFAIKPALRSQDVYDVGNLLLELVTGKCFRDGRDGTREALAAIESGFGHRILDPRLGKESQSAVIKMGDIAAWCMTDKDTRPSIVDVASALRQVTTMFIRLATTK